MFSSFMLYVPWVSLNYVPSLCRSYHDSEIVGEQGQFIETYSFRIIPVTSEHSNYVGCLALSVLNLHSKLLSDLLFIGLSLEIWTRLDTKRSTISTTILESSSVGFRSSHLGWCKWFPLFHDIFILHAVILYQLSYSQNRFQVFLVMANGFER